jgi:hypothetical protein
LREFTSDRRGAGFARPLAVPPLRGSGAAASGVGLHQLCINLRLREIDINMPSAKPIVTIAVPP